MSSHDPRCFACGGPFHPASGNHFAEGVDYCGRCYRYFLAYFKDRMRVRRKGRADFYTEAATSIRPPA